MTVMTWSKEQEHPSFIRDLISREPQQMVDSFVAEAVRFYALMTCINGISKEMALKLSKPKYYTLLIDEESDPNNFLLSIVEVKE